MRRILPLLLTLCLLCSVFIGCKETETAGIHPPLSANDCEGMQYQKVAAQFEASGFTNIEYDIIDEGSCMTKERKPLNGSLVLPKSITVFVILN